MKFLPAAAALKIMKAGHELHAWYDINGASIFLLNPARDRIKWPSLELMRKKQWIVELPRKPNQSLSLHRYGVRSDDIHHQ